MPTDLNQEQASGRRTVKWCAIGTALGLGLSLVVYSTLFLGKTTRFDEVAIGEGDSHFAIVDGAPVHCRNIADSHSCLAPALAKSANKHFLWLGNSQLHAINQRKLSDRSAPEILHLKLTPFGYLVTFSEPNASPQEHLVLASYLLPRLKPKILLLPVVFDDFRETGLRKDIESALQDEVTRGTLRQSNIGKELILESERKPKTEDDLAGLHATIQERSERSLTEWLLKNSKMWEARPEARGQVFLFLYQLRNHLLGIGPTTARKMIRGRFAKNWAALEATVAVAKTQGTQVFIYVAPLRDDVPIPYDETEYKSFKARLLSEFPDIPRVTVQDLERVVPNDLWGTKEATTLGEVPEYDFMHFRAAGHEALAQVLFEQAFGKRLGEQ